MEEGTARCLLRSSAAAAEGAQNETQATLSGGGAEQGPTDPAQQQQHQWPLTLLDVPSHP